MAGHPKEFQLHRQRVTFPRMHRRAGILLVVALFLQWLDPHVRLGAQGDPRYGLQGIIPLGGPHNNQAYIKSLAHSPNGDVLLALQEASSTFVIRSLSRQGDLGGPFKLDQSIRSSPQAIATDLQRGLIYIDRTGPGVSNKPIEQLTPSGASKGRLALRRGLDASISSIDVGPDGSILATNSELFQAATIYRWSENGIFEGQWNDSAGAIRFYDLAQNSIGEAILATVDVESPNRTKLLRYSSKGSSVGSFRFTWPTTLGPSRPSILEPFGIDSLFADWQQHEIVAVMQGGLGGLHLQGADERDGTTKWAVPLWQYTRNNDPLTFQESDGSVSPNGTIALQWGPWSRLDSTENPLGAVTQLTRDGRFESITRFDFQPVPSAQLLSETWSRVRVADMGTQTLVLYPRAGQYAVFQAGREIALRNAPPFALDLAADADGIVVRGWDGVDGRITMLSSDGNQVWTRSCNCQLSTGIALDKTHVLVIDSLRDKLLVFERSDGTPIAQWPLRKAGSAPLVDVAGIESKYAAVIDSSGVVQVIDVETGAIRSTLIAKAGLPAQAIAANGDTLVLLTQDQSVEVISNSGQSLQRWSLPAEVHASDVSIDQAGQIHVLDFGGKSLLLFGLDQTMPAGEIAPGEPLLQSDTVCGASGMATTNTSSVRLGALVTLSIEAAFRCLSKPQHVDIVVVLNPNRQQLYLYDSARIDEVLRQMQPVLNRDQWRISLVADDPSTNTVRVVAPFGTDETTWNQQIDQLIRPANDSLNEVRPGLDVMATVALNYLRIESSAERLQVIVLVDEPAGAVTAESKLSDFRATGGVVQELQLLGMFPPSLTELSLEKGIDTRIPVGPLGDIAVLATDLARRSGQTPPRDVTLELVVSREVMLEPDSVQPPALQQDQELRWWFASLGDPYTDVRLAVRPTRLGTVSIAEPARLIYTDHAGQRRYIDIPVPTVDVIDVQLTPQAFNTPTSTATSSLGSATPSGSRRVFLPTLLRLLCDGADRNADVVLALDTSTSMLEPTSPGGKSKLDSAREAARTFLQMMVPRRDQAALIQFNSSATILVDLSDQPALAIAALDRLSVDEGTNISHALNIGVNILAGPRRRASNNAVFILLTDGVPTGTTHEEVRQAAIEAQRAAMVFTIGVGQFVDRALLQSMASQPAYSYFAPNSADLNTIYQAIAYSIPCRSGWP